MSATSNAYCLRWQRDAHRALGEFLAAASGSGMPALAWTIATTGALVGDVDSLTATPVEMRAAFEAWTASLGARVLPERTGRDGVTHLYATFAWDKNDQVRGAIRASIYPPMGVDHTP